MCAIAGIVDWEKPPQWLKSRTDQMSETLAHRGPDDSGNWQGPGISLAHRRLSLIDVAGGGQPFIDPEDRFVLVYNGEIYNYADLRNELRPHHVFQTESDTEVLLAAWKHWGEKCLHRLNGMFAFFVWDRDLQSGFAARDCLGVKPFAYTFEDETFAFASEAKALLPLFKTPPRADREAILEYLVAPCFSGVETSPFQSVEYLQPGQCLRISRSGLQTDYWTNVFHQPDHWLDDDGLSSDTLQSLLPRAVERAFTADVPVGTYLSGGFDSTLVTSLARQHADPGLTAFTVAFDGHEMFDQSHSDIVLSDDLPFARNSAQEMKINLQEVSVGEQSLNELLKQLTASNDALPAWEQEIAQYRLAEAASEKYKAVLVGDAADETHYGYQFLLRDEVCQSPSSVFGNRFSAPVRNSTMSHPLEYFEEKYRCLIAESGHRRGTPEERRGAMNYLIVKRWLPRLLHNGDIHAMAHGLEARVPFADTELLSFAQSVPPDLAFRNQTEKWFLRSASKGLLPESVRTRTKSALPKSPRGWQSFRQELLTDLDHSLDLFNPVLDCDATRKLILKESPATEPEQSLFFRLTAMKHWFHHFKVSWT